MAVTIDCKRQTVMFMDAIRMIDGKRVNAEATEVYRARCKPGILHSIHGNVIIVDDNDFA